MTDAEIKRISNYMDVQAEPRQADLAFVFGTRLLEPASLAYDLFRRGVVRYIVLTGGANRLTGVNEAHAHLTILQAAGVPRDRIIVEDRSTNTYENVIFALPEIDATLGLDQLSSVVVITKWYHLRRAMMTLKRQLRPGVRYYTLGYEPDGCARQAWESTPESYEKVLGNMERIARYLAADHLMEVEWDGDAFV
jgi:hypothetical protein